MIDYALLAPHKEFPPQQHASAQTKSGRRIQQCPPYLQRARVSPVSPCTASGLSAEERDAGATKGNGSTAPGTALYPTPL